MDKRKLVDIIIKDLEEIRVLSEEVAESDDDSALIIDLALNRARLLCQEIGLLREMAGNITARPEETYQVDFDSEEEDSAHMNFPDPELEILNFEEDEEDGFSTSDELPEQEDDLEDTEEEETEELNEDLEEDLEEEEEDLIEIEEEDQEEVPEEDLEEDDEDLEEDDLEEEDIEEETQEEEEEETVQQQPTIQGRELKHEIQPGMREIHIDDLDDEDDLEPMRFSHSTGSAARPPMREIPKPEFLEPEGPENEKKLVGEKYQKERSLNDTIAEKKSVDSHITNGRITSLRAAIGLNDRFLFIREIFDNNSEKYNKVIEQLDKMEKIQEAVEYLKANLSMQKNEASMKFVELLKRRFTP